MKYEEALALMKKAKNPSKGKPIANNTRLHSCLDGSFEIKLHGHPIITIHPNHVTLNSCGYRTRTTKERMKTFAPEGINVIQRNYKWYVTLPSSDEILNIYEEVPFYDGIKIGVKE